MKVLKIGKVEITENAKGSLDYNWQNASFSTKDSEIVDEVAIVESLIARLLIDLKFLMDKHE